MTLLQIYSRSKTEITLTRTITLSCLTALAITATINQPSNAESRSFYCQTSKGIPVTFARTQDGRKIPLIRWTSNNYFPPPWTTRRRCVEVSKRFQRNYDNGTLKYITNGTLNRQPVICAGISRNTSCTNSNLLFTLKAGANPKTVVSRLLDSRGLASGEIFAQTASDDDINVDFDMYLNNVEAEE